MITAIPPEKEFLTAFTANVGPQIQAERHHGC
jgi:hypothetical protein